MRSFFHMTALQIAADTYHLPFKSLFSKLKMFVQLFFFFFWRCCQITPYSFNSSKVMMIWDSVQNQPLISTPAPHVVFCPFSPTFTKKDYLQLLRTYPIPPQLNEVSLFIPLSYIGMYLHCK